MNATEVGRQLVRALLDNPKKFNDDGRAYELLQACFNGFPVEALRPLLRSEAPLVRKAAVFVLSELGWEARELIDDIIPLLAPRDRYLQYHAMEILAVCCEGGRAQDFLHVVLQLENQDDVLRGLAMRLVSRADTSQLKAATLSVSQVPSHQGHKKGLEILVAGESIDPESVSKMIMGSDSLLRRYGAIAAKRLLSRFPSLMGEVGASDDDDLRRFQ